MADNGDLWDELLNEGREFLEGRGDDEFMYTLHELYGIDPDLAKDAIYEMTSDPVERHELWTAMMYE